MADYVNDKKETVSVYYWRLLGVLPAGVVNGVIIVVNQLRNGQEGIPICHKPVYYGG